MQDLYRLTAYEARELVRSREVSVRELVELVSADLVAFRRTLHAVFGRNDKDYQRLRVKQAHVADEYDDENAPDSPVKGRPDDPDADDPAAPDGDEPAAPEPDQPVPPVA